MISAFIHKTNCLLLNVLKLSKMLTPNAFPYTVMVNPIRLSQMTQRVAVLKTAESRSPSGKTKKSSQRKNKLIEV